MTTSRQYRLWQPILLGLLCLVAYYVLKLQLIESLLPAPLRHWHVYAQVLEKACLSLLAITAIVFSGRLMERFIDRSAHVAGVRYNLVRLTRLLGYVLIVIVAVSFLFQNLYAAAYSVGLISLVLGFALQAPIASFIAWLYIVFRHPYHVGDRIQLGTLRGDVVEIGYLDTTVRECSGDYLGNDRISGRIVRFPNSIILKQEVINYAGPLIPFIWNETAIQVAWTSNLAFVEQCLCAAADLDFRARYPDRQRDADTCAAVYFRDNPHAWLEAVVSYPVEPTDTTGRRNRILRSALPSLQSERDKVQLPQGTRR